MSGGYTAQPILPAPGASFRLMQRRTNGCGGVVDVRAANDTMQIGRVDRGGTGFDRIPGKRLCGGTRAEIGEAYLVAIQEQIDAATRGASALMTMAVPRV
jgi:hypothetical protein